MKPDTKKKMYSKESRAMVKFLSVVTLCVFLSTGCLATKLLIPGGEPLTIEETKTLDTVKETVGDVVETVGFVAKHTNDVLVPGGAGTAILIALGAYLNRRRKKKDAG